MSLEEWVGEDERRAFEGVGIHLKKAPRHTFLTQIYKREIKKKQMVDPSLSHGVAQETVEREELRCIRDGSGERWEISPDFLKALGEEYVENKQWVSASGLVSYAITGAVKTNELLLQRFADSLSRDMHFIDGVPENLARAKVEKAAVRQEDANGKVVWQIRKSALDGFKAWIWKEREWISATDSESLLNLGITNHAVRMGRIVGDLLNQEKEFLIANGIPEDRAQYEIESTQYRLGPNSHHNTVFQFHENETPAIKRRLEFLSPSSLQGSGIVEANVITIAREVQELHDKKIEEAVHKGMSPVVAAYNVERNIAVYATADHGERAWLLHPDYIKELPSLRKKEGKAVWEGLEYRGASEADGEDQLKRRADARLEKMHADELRAQEKRQAKAEYGIERTEKIKVAAQAEKAAEKERAAKEAAERKAAEKERVAKEAAERKAAEKERAAKEAAERKAEEKLNADSAFQITWKTFYQVSQELGIKPVEAEALFQRVVRAAKEKLGDEGLNPEEIEACLQEQYTKEAGGSSIRKVKLISSVAIAEMKALREVGNENATGFAGRVQQSRTGVSHCR